MALGKPPQSGTASRALVLGQVIAAMLGMGTLLFAPRGDEPVVLYPLSEAAAQNLPKILSQPEIMLMAEGRLDSSFVVSGVRPAFSEALLDHGVLVLNAAAPGCGPTPQKAWS